MMMIKLRKIVALKSSGKEESKVATNLLILGNALILLRGLSTLKVLRDLRFTLVATKSNILKIYKFKWLTQLLQ